jgi:carbon storage regulator
MLALQRAVNERIRIGPEITITICRIRGDLVRVGIEAPQDYLILRDEIPAPEGWSELEPRGTSYHGRDHAEG